MSQSKPSLCPPSLNLIAVFLLHISVFSQLKEATTFGKIDKADLQRTSCAYDPEANAEVLSDIGEYRLEFMNTAIKSNPSQARPHQNI